MSKKSIFAGVWFWLVIGLAYLFGGVTVACAQPYTGCRHTRTNLQNSGADIAVDGTSGGIVVMGAATGTSQGRCAAIFKNSGTGQARCTSAGDGTPTATVGFPLNAGETLNLGFEGSEQYKCIRTTSTSTTIAVIEAVP